MKAMEKPFLGVVLGMLLLFSATGPSVSNTVNTDNKPKPTAPAPPTQPDTEEPLPEYFNYGGV